MAQTPRHKDSDLIGYSIFIDGKEMSEEKELLSAEITREVNKIPTAKIVIIDGDPSKEEFEISEKEGYEPGTPIRIAAGYHQKMETIFEGVIVTHGAKIKESHASELTIECIDKVATLAQKKKNEYFENMSDSDIINKILGNYSGIKKDVESTNIKHKKIVQYNSSDWDFIVTRAEINGKIVVVENAKVIVKKPNLKNPKIKLTHGHDMKKINLKLDSKKQLSQVKYSAWDMTTQKIVEVTSDESNINYPFGKLTGKKMAEAIPDDTFEMHTTAPLDKDYMKSWANAKLMRSRLSRVRGNISFQGNHQALPNSVVNVNGMGENMNGDAFVSKVTHNIRAGEWTTEVGIGVDAESFSESKSDIKSSTGGIPGVEGLYNGVVKKIHADPDGDMRILVDIPVIAESGDGVWARISSPYATKDAGIFFMPEVGDEVVLGFLGSDPRYPIILGSLHSKKRTAAYDPDQPNTFKGIVTNSKLKIEFEDKKKEITIETPGGNTVIISDAGKSIKIKDQNNNKVELTTSGILLDSPKDITIKAKGKIVLDAIGNLEAKSRATTKVEGTNVNVKANAQFEAKGAMAKLNGTGMTEVKGGIVKIN